MIREACAGIVEGLRYLVDHPSVLRTGVVKATWTLGAGGLVYSFQMAVGLLWAL